MEANFTYSYEFPFKGENNAQYSVTTAAAIDSSSDAIVIVVSEENGIISVAVDGQLRRNYDYNSLKAELSKFLHDDNGENIAASSN